MLTRLIAIMLGRLYMDVEECIAAYRQLSEEVFGRPRSLASRGTAFLSNYIKPKFDSGVLKVQILRIIQERLQIDDPSTAPLRDLSSESTCKV